MIQKTVNPLLKYLLFVVTKHLIIGLCITILEIFLSPHYLFLFSGTEVKTVFLKGLMGYFKPCFNISFRL
jgi:hypothetical protein